MKQKKKNHLWIIPVLIMLLALGGTYGFGYYYAGEHFLPNTTIDGESADRKTTGEMNTELLDRETAPVLTVIEKTLDGKTIEEKLDLKTAAGFTKTVSTDHLLKQQDRLLWFLSFFRKTELSSKTSEWQMDEELLKQFCSDLYAFRDENTVEPENAYLDYKDGQFFIVPCSDGLKIDKQGAMEYILAGAKAATTGGDMTLDLSQFYQSALIREDNESLLTQLNSLQSVLDKTITVEIPDNQNVHGTEILSGSALLNLLTIDNFQFAVNSEAVESYVQRLSEKYNLSQYEYLDQEQLLKDIKSVLLSDKDEDVTAVWTMITPPDEIRSEGEEETEDDSGYSEQEDNTENEDSSNTEENANTEENTNSEENDENSEESEESQESSQDTSSQDEESSQDNSEHEGETCIYVSIVDQYLWYYKNGELIVSCPVVTGNPNADYNSTTPTGTYQVQRIAGASTLAGADYVEYVDYWIGFDWETAGGMLGFHDASWRSEFGGDIYLTDPSHGCVNMPTWAVAIMWENVEYGTKVVIY